MTETMKTTGRRGFVQALVGGAAVGGLGLPLRAAEASVGYPQLSGTSFDLVIGRFPVDVTGRPSHATLVNGLLPGPVLRWCEGDRVTLNVTNRLTVPSSIHWHGIRLPAGMDGVPGLSFAGIAPGETFTYQFPVQQSGTYWYHSHSGFQEQTGLYGAIIIEPRGGEREAFDRDYVVLLSDWTDTEPSQIVSNLKFQSDYYNFHQLTAGSFLADAHAEGVGATLDNRLQWARMRMSQTDISDVSGHSYTYLCNGQPPGANWTGLFRPGERVRLRFINGSSMTFFDVRIPGLTMSVVQADGNDVVPVAVDEFRIGAAETYDVIVQPTADAYTIFAQSEDRTGYARGTLSCQVGRTAPVPPMDPRPRRSMTDMGMGRMAGMAAPETAAVIPMAKPAMPGAMAPSASQSMMSSSAQNRAAPTMNDAGLAGRVGVDNVAMDPVDRLGDPGDGLRHNGRRVLTYADLRATKPGTDPRPPSRTITLHLTGNMDRYIWGFDGRKFSDAGPIPIKLGERVRFTLINDTMMEHPIHLHGLWSELENGNGAYRPYKHTVIVQPGERLSYLVTADTPGRWAYHCHLLYHMEMGMFRVVAVA